MSVTTSTTRVSDTRVRRLAAVLHCYAFLDDFILLYPVYALLLSDTGLSVGQISSLFVVWSATGILLEIPSGAWADAVSRRLLLVLGPLVTAAGYALWVTVPSYAGFAVGFVCWGVGGVLVSGALEALVWDGLDRYDATDRYAPIMGRARAAGVLGVFAATALAGPVVAVGGYPAVGAASVLACLLGAAVATRFPEPRAADRRAAGPTDEDVDDSGAAGAGWSATLRSGLAEARADRKVRAAVLLVPAVSVIWGGLEEYTPLLARETGVDDATVPLLLLLVSAGVAAGGLLAGPAARLGVGRRGHAGPLAGRKGYALLLTVGAVALGVGAALRHPAGFLLVGVAFCVLQLATVLADARLQASITGPARATATSLAGMGGDVGVIVVYAGYSVFAGHAGHSAAFVVSAVPYLLMAAWLVRPGAGSARRTTVNR